MGEQPPLRESTQLPQIIDQADASCRRPLFSIINYVKQGAADLSSLRESRRAAGWTEEKSEERRDTRGERRDDKKEKTDETEMTEGKKESI